MLMIDVRVLISNSPPLKTDWSDQRHLATAAAAAMCGRLIKLIAKKINMLKPKKIKNWKEQKPKSKISWANNDI